MDVQKADMGGGFNSRVREGRDVLYRAALEYIKVSTHASARDATRIPR